MSKKNHSNTPTLQTLKSGTKAQKNQIVGEMIENIKPQLASHIYNKYSIYRANLQDKVLETLQEAYIRLFENIKKPGFTLKTTLEGYFWGICKIYLLEETRAARLGGEMPKEEPKEDEASIDPKESELDIALFEELMQEMGGDCAQVIRYKYENIQFGKKARSGKEVAEHFGYTEAYVRVKISECRKKLIELKDKKLGIKK